MSDQSRTNTVPQRQRQYPAGYGLIEPVSNYRPWDVDAEFQDVYAAVRDHTMVDVFRLWTLWFIAGQLPSGDVLEVGSWRGGSGAVIGRSIARRADGRTLVLADTFPGVVKASRRDSYYKGGEHANTSPDTVRDLLERAGVAGAELLVGVFPEETAAAVADRRFALCHIDVDVYQSARDCFDWVWPRMVAGGVVVFDDYGFYGCEGVTSCVLELADRTGSPVAEPLVVIPSLSGQAVVVKAQG